MRMSGLHMRGGQGDASMAYTPRTEPERGRNPFVCDPQGSASLSPGSLTRRRVVWSLELESLGSDPGSVASYLCDP